MNPGAYAPNLIFYRLLNQPPARGMRRHGAIMETPPVPAVQAQSAAQEVSAKSALPYVVAITSGKGGVGKSSIAVNLGLSLAKTGARVCILDADTGLANVNILLGLAPKFSLEHVLFGAKTVEEVMLEGPFGLKVIPGANGISECVSLHPRQQLRLTRELARIEGEFDYLLLDTAAGIADTTLDFVGSSHRALVVITPEPTSLTDAFSLIKLMHRRRPTLSYQVVVNLCGSAPQAREVYHRFSAAVEKYIGVQTHYLGFLLRDESLRAAVTLQSPVALFPDSDPSSRSFIRLAEALQHTLEGFQPGIGFSGFWLRQFRQHQAGAQTRQPKSAADMAAAERGYLAELRSRLMLLLERQDAPREALAALLDEAQQAYTRRFGQPPAAMDVMGLIDTLASAPERNDEQLRALAERLRPWMVQEAPEPTPAADALIETHIEASGVETSGVATPAGLFINTDAPARPDGAGPDLAHRYDERRYGSQQALLELLRSQGKGGRPALELIDILG